MSYTSVTRLTSVPTTNPEMGYSGFGAAFPNVPTASNVAANFVNTAKGYVPSAVSLRDVGMKSIAPSLVPAAWGTVGGKSIGPTFREESTPKPSAAATVSDQQSTYDRSSSARESDTTAQTEADSESNTMLYVGIGAAVVAVGAALFLLRKK